jgi:hypothetical protein
MDIAKSRDFLLKENKEQSLDEMAKIQGALKDAIEAVIASNPDLNGLPLKKAIRADQTVLDALDGDDLYDNQLNKFIASAKGERTVGPRGRKVTDASAKQDIAADLGTSTQSLNKLLSEPSFEDEEIGLEPEIEDEEEITDTWNTGDEEDEIDDKGPKKSDIDTSIEKEVPSDVSSANAFKNIITKKVGKIENAVDAETRTRELAALKQYIQNPNVKKTLGVQTIRDLVSSIIG